MSKTAMLVGLGNTGSNAVPNLARSESISTLILVDHDRVEAGNVMTQNVTQNDIGRYKVDVAADLVAAINPDLTVCKIYLPVQKSPAGDLRCDLIVGCVDNLLGRQFLNQLSQRFGVPYIDCGINPEHRLVRVSVFDSSSENAPCMECAWGDRDYSQLEQKYACQKQLPVTATNAPVWLGGLAGALVAAEADKLLKGEPCGLANRQLVMDVGTHRQFVIGLERNLYCRFDHRKLPELRKVSIKTILGELLEQEDDVLYLEDWQFVTNMVCPQCGSQSPPMLFLYNRDTEGGAAVCERCGAHRVATAAGVKHRLSRRDIATQWSTSTLQQIGLLKNDIAMLVQQHHETALLLED